MQLPRTTQNKKSSGSCRGAIASPAPFITDNQGKACATAIVSSIHAKKIPEPSYVNTCYSLVLSDYGISAAVVYHYSSEKGIYKVKGSGGVILKDTDAAFRKQEACYTKD